MLELKDLTRCLKSLIKALHRSNHLRNCLHIWKRYRKSKDSMGLKTLVDLYQIIQMRVCLRHLMTNSRCFKTCQKMSKSKCWVSVCLWDFSSKIGFSRLMCRQTWKSARNRRMVSWTWRLGCSWSAKARCFCSKIREYMNSFWRVRTNSRRRGNTRPPWLRAIAMAHLPR